jgi:type IV secretory pathway VirB10-like protein
MLFHVLVVTLGLISWPFLQDKDTNAQPLIIVDVVATLPKTNLADSSAAKSSPEPEQEATRKKPPPPPPPPPPPEPKAGRKSAASKASTAQTRHRKGRNFA